MQGTTIDLLIGAIDQIKLVNPSVAADLTNLIPKITKIENQYHKVEQRVLSLNSTDPAVLSGDQTLIDLNEDLRNDVDALFTLLSSPIKLYEVIGAVKFVSLLNPSKLVSITSREIAMEGGQQGLETALQAFLSNAWEVILLNELPPYEQGTNGAEVFIGNINGGTVELLGGNDVFIPNDTNDAYDVKGGSGDDVILGGTSNGGSLSGDHSHSSVQGGNDTIIASNGVLQISGNAGDDWLQVEGEGTNALKGNDGSDTIIGGAYKDKLYGTDLPLNASNIANAPASDTNYIIGRGGGDVIDGGIGNDYLVGDHFDDMLLSGERAIFDVFRSAVEDKIETSGGAGNDTITGYGGDDVIAGGGGNDLIYGDDRTGAAVSFGYGDDILYGDGGNDTLVGGKGLDRLFGGVGKNVLYADKEQEDSGGDGQVDFAYVDEDDVVFGDGDVFWASQQNHPFTAAYY